MATETDRIRRYLDGDIDRCRSEDVEVRLSELDVMVSSFESERIEADIDVLSTLGNETRYRLIRVLVDAGDELCVCELNAVVDVSESAISHALSDLHDAGLVTRRKDGRWRMYRSTPLASALLSALDEVRGDE